MWPLSMCRPPRGGVPFQCGWGPAAARGTVLGSLEGGAAFTPRIGAAVAGSPAEPAGSVLAAPVYESRDPPDGIPHSDADPLAAHPRGL